MIYIKLLMLFLKIYTSDHCINWELEEKTTLKMMRGPGVESTHLSQTIYNGTRCRYGTTLHHHYYPVEMHKRCTV